MTKKVVFTVIVIIMLMAVVLRAPMRIMPEEMRRKSFLFAFSNTGITLKTGYNLNKQNLPSKEAKVGPTKPDRLNIFMSGQQLDTEENMNFIGKSLFQNKENLSSRNITKIGEWMPGFKYSKTCVTKELLSLPMGADSIIRRPFECCGEQERKLHFQFFNQSLNNEHVVTEFLRKMKGKTVTILGDSLQRGLFWGMVEVLQLGKSL